jgi:hypothetical protein
MVLGTGIPCTDPAAELPGTDKHNLAIFDVRTGHVDRVIDLDAFFQLGTIQDCASTQVRALEFTGLPMEIMSAYYTRPLTMQAIAPPTPYRSMICSVPGYCCSQLIRVPPSRSAETPDSLMPRPAPMPATQSGI